jgi:hypothetical protein
VSPWAVQQISWMRNDPSGLQSSIHHLEIINSSGHCGLSSHRSDSFSFFYHQSRRTIRQGHWTTANRGTDEKTHQTS